MTDLQASMGGRRKRSVSGSDPEPTSAAGALAHANRSAAKPYPHKLTLELSEVQYRALRYASADDGVTVSDRLRGLIAQWIEAREHGDTGTRGYVEPVRKP